MLYSLLENSLNLDTGVYIFLTVLFFLLCVGVSVLCVFRIRHDRRIIRNEKFKIKELDRLGFEQLLKHKYEIAGDKLFFSVMLIGVEQVEKLKLSLGEKQTEKIIGLLRDRIIRVIPRGSKMCDYDEGRLAIYMEDDFDNTSLSNIALVILSECAKPIMLFTRTKLQVNINIGVVCKNEISPDAVSLLQNIELAYSSAEKLGVNKYVIYSEELAETQTEEYKKYQEIKEAIKNCQFTVYFQPVVRFSDKKVIAYESLVRWQHPTLGILSPDKFLPIMEQTGDINWIGTWAFDYMLKMQTKHYREHPEDSELLFSFNLSPKQLMYPHLAEELRKVYKRYRIPAQNICFEIVEFSLFDKIQEVSSNILKLRQMGFQIAVDDFGLEMSSLKNLDQLEFDWLKLDRLFVEKAQDDFLADSLVGTLTAFAERKKFNVVAEGIEDDITEDYVKRLNIGYGQGYYFGKPLPAEEYNL